MINNQNIYYDFTKQTIEQFTYPVQQPYSNFYNQPQNINYYSHNPQYNARYPHPSNIVNDFSNYYPYYQNYTYPSSNQKNYIDNIPINSEIFRNINIPYSNLFRTISDYAASNKFEGGFPTFWTYPDPHSPYPYYQVLLINPQYGVKDDLINLDPSPKNFAVHIKNVNNVLREDSRYLGGFPNFNVSSSGNRFGATRLFPNAGIKKFASDYSDIGIIEPETDENLMKRVQRYVESQPGFAAGFPTFRHKPGQHEIILLYPNAVTVRKEKFPLYSP